MAPPNSDNLFSADSSVSVCCDRLQASRLTCSALAWCCASCSPGRSDTPLTAVGCTRLGSMRSPSACVSLLAFALAQYPFDIMSGAPQESAAFDEALCKGTVSVPLLLPFSSGESVDPVGTPRRPQAHFALSRQDCGQPFRARARSGSRFVVSSICNGAKSSADLVPSVSQSLVEDCWQENPEDRPSVDEILARLVRAAPVACACTCKTGQC